MSLLRNPGVNEHQRLTLAALKALKILSRKRSNRLAMINKDEALRIGLQLIQVIYYFVEE